MSEPVVIAIDGPAAAGKGTLARRIATAFRLPYLDTGLLYRAAARRILDQGRDPGNPADAEAAARDLTLQDLQSPALRTPEIDRAAALVASIPGVRAALLAFQRGFGAAHGAVLDGRDIGTIIFPGARIKFFVTASLDARAQRRWLELCNRGVAADLATVRADLLARDSADASRTAAPLQAADDAILLDTTGIDADQAFAAALSHLAEAGLIPPAG